MRKIDQLLNEYGESHQNPTNKKIHWVCVPLIFWSVVAIVWSFPNAVLNEFLPASLANWAVLALLLTMLYYLFLSFSLFVGMGVFSIICLWLVNYFHSVLPFPVWQFALVVFVLAWVGQFYGHKIEGKKPSFFKDLQFLLIGPAWLMHFLLQKLGLKY